MTVPVARRQLFAHRGRMLAGVAGIAVALLLILALNGIMAGMEQRVTAFIDRSGADVIVAQGGVDTIHMSESTLPQRDARAIAAVPGVARVRPLLLVTTTVDRGDKRGLVYLVGEQRPGTTIATFSGSSAGPGEIVIDRNLAGTLNAGIGSTVRTLGGSLRVSGEIQDTQSHTNSVAVTTATEVSRLVGTRGVFSYVLVNADPGVSSSTLAANINRAVPGVKASTRSTFASSERRLVGDMSTDIVRAMTFVGFVIGVSVAALVAYSLTLAQLRDYAVLQAVGLRARRALALVFAQVGASVTAGFALALGLVWALASFMSMHSSSMEIAIRFGDVAKAIVVAALVAIFAAAFPVIRVSRIDPASVFRR